MSRVRRFALSLAGLGLGIGLVASACGSEPLDGTHPGHGVVVAVDPAAGSITIDHEDIPGFMKGMTMTFEAADPSVLQGVSSGQEVDFRVKEEQGHYIVTEIQRLR